MKKNNKLIYGLFVLITLVSFTGCIKEEKLDTASQTDFFDKTPFETETRIEHQVRGIYSGLRSGQFLGGRYHIYNDARAENYLSDDPNRVTARAAWEFSEADSDNEVNNLWNACYAVINRVNIFIAGMEEVGNAVLNDAAKSNSYIAEARTARAIAYYGLMQFYAKPYTMGNGNNPGVPLRLTAIQSYGSNDLALSSVADIYTQILEDLNWAETNIAEVNANATLNTTRFHKNTVIAFKTRVLLSMGRYPDVITEANKIVSASAPFKSSTGVELELLDNPASLFSSPMNKEILFAFPFTTQETPGTQNQLGFYYLPRGFRSAQGIFYLNPSGVIGDPNWSADDARRDFISTVSGKNYTNKFGQGTPFIDWVPLIRYAEVLLNLAEAIARTNTLTIDARAIELLNAVRMRSDPDTEFEAADFADNDALIAQILQERNIEFVGEGIRSLDILRLNLPFPAKAVPGGVSVDAVPPTNQAYIWPIPSEEVRHNKAIQ